MCTTSVPTRSWCGTRTCCLTSRVKRARYWRSALDRPVHRRRAQVAQQVLVPDQDDEAVHPVGPGRGAERGPGGSLPPGRGAGRARVGRPGGDQEARVVLRRVKPGVLGLPGPDQELVADPADVPDLDLVAAVQGDGAGVPVVA